MNPALQSRLDQAAREFRAGQPEKARATLQRLAAQHPAAAEPVLALALLHDGTRQWEQSAYFAQRAADLAPRDPAIVGQAANLLLVARRFEGAAALYARLIALGAMGHGEHGLANTLLEQERFTEALEHARRAHALLPGHAPVLLVLAGALTVHGRAEEAVALLEAAPGLDDDPDLASLLCFASNYCPGRTPGQVFEAHTRFGAIVERSARRDAPPFPNERDPERRLRVGLLSRDLRRHPVAIFLEPWLARHDRDRIELFLYHTHPRQDDVTSRLKKHAAQWRDWSNISDDAAERQVRADRIDVLLDTSGITTGHRAELLARRPAPVQAMFLGYPGTTGLRSVDYRIVDAITEPPGWERFSTEKQIRLDPTFLCFRADETAPGLTSPPSHAAPEGRVTFGSFNATQKINPGVIDAWCRVLKGVPGSRLLLKTVHLIDPGLRRFFEGEFAARGIEAGRVEVLPPTPPYADHLAHYARVDVALDTFPYNGTTTTLEALYMGVPVVGLLGQGHPGRVGETVLKAIGREGWLGPDIDGYVSRAVGLAGDARLRTQLRGSGPDGLRAALQASPLMDETRHARQMDEALRTMWREWCARQPGR